MTIKRSSTSVQLRSLAIGQQYFVDLFETDVAWDELCEPGKQLELEIGSGKGLFLQQAAQCSPDRSFIGIELAAKFAKRAAQRLEQQDVKNAVMLRGDAKRFLQETVPDQSISRLHVYFPDPWWRNKHKKRRVLNERSLLDVQRVLVPGGEFHFWTDVLDYYEHICRQVIEITQLSGPKYVPEKDAVHTMDYTTHFERRARLNSQPVYRAVFIRAPAA